LSWIRRQACPLPPPPKHSRTAPLDHKMKAGCVRTVVRYVRLCRDRRYLSRQCQEVELPGSLDQVYTVGRSPSQGHCHDQVAAALDEVAGTPKHFEVQLEGELHTLPEPMRSGRARALKHLSSTAAGIKCYRTAQNS
jgi:hypothetical protein